MTAWEIITAVGLALAALAGGGVAMAAGPSAWREKILARAREHVQRHTLYEWGGGHHPGSWGLDCSGLVIDCAARAGIDLRGWDSHRMWTELPRVVEPQGGDLACYAPRHVVIVEGYDSATKTASIIGANGGDSTSTSPERAAQQGAFVRREPSHLYRSGFLGFVSLQGMAPQGNALLVAAPT